MRLLIKSKLLPGICILLLITLTYSVSALTIEPSSIESSLYLNQTEIIKINITNTHPFNVYNLSFSPTLNIAYPRIDFLESGKTIEAEIIINPETSFQRTAFTSKVSFNYYTNISQNPETIEITITDSQYSPQSKDIYQGDSIIWNNQGTIQHSVTCSEFDQSLQPQNTYQRAFNEIKTIDYWDKYTGFHGYLNIKDRTVQELTYNSDYDKTFITFLTSLYAESIIDLSLDTDNFSIEPNGMTEGMVKVQNTGNKTAIGINLNATSNWIVFNENSFNLTAGQTNYITFTIVPYMEYSNQTNKTYLIDITAKGKNTNHPTDTLSLFIKYMAEPDIASTEEWWQQKVIFCNQFPTSPFCITEPVKEIVKQTVYKEPEIPYNFTWRDIDRMMTNINEINTKVTRLDNTQKIQGGKLENITQDISIIKEDIAWIRKDYKNKSITDWIYLITFVIIIAMIVVFLIFTQSGKIKKIKEMLGMKEAD